MNGTIHVQPVDLAKAKYLADNCDPESAYERQLSKALRGLVTEVERLRSDLDLACAQRSAAFRKIEQLQDEGYGAVKVAMTELASFYDSLLGNPDTERMYADEVANGIRQRFGVDRPHKSKAEGEEGSSRDVAL